MYIYIRNDEKKVLRNGNLVASVRPHKRVARNVFIHNET